MYFGVDYDDESRGPFYCGMSVVLNIPQFAIRLNGPTSTSLHIEVAMRFGGTQGMIIQLNNEGENAEDERHFDCEWLSAFPEESERLFMGGRYPLQLETVRVVETNNNYRRFLRAFHLFDCMLSGDWPSRDIKVLYLVVSSSQTCLGFGETSKTFSHTKDTPRTQKGARDAYKYTQTQTMIICPRACPRPRQLAVQPNHVGVALQHGPAAPASFAARAPARPRQQRALPLARPPRSLQPWPLLPRLSRAPALAARVRLSATCWRR